jgi:hypothetical protein
VDGVRLGLKERKSVVDFLRDPAATNWEILAPALGELETNCQRRHMLAIGACTKLLPSSVPLHEWVLTLKQTSGKTSSITGKAHAYISNHDAVINQNGNKKDITVLENGKALSKSYF